MKWSFTIYVDECVEHKVAQSIIKEQEPSLRFTHSAFMHFYRKKYNKLVQSYTE